MVSNPDFGQLVDTIIAFIFEPVTLLIGAVAVIYFLLGVLKYIQSTDSEEKRKEGITMMTYGIIGLFVMVSMWGLVTVLTNSFGLQNTPIDFPTTTR